MTQERERFFKPQVFVIGETKLCGTGLYDYLEAIGAEDWACDAPSQAESIAEVYGRLCYRSFGVGLNKNVTKVREGNDAYLGNINKSGHGAVLEHSTVNFIFYNVSRVFTHELVRHRVGVAISQESMRYVRLDDLKYYDDPLLTREAKDIFCRVLKFVECAVEDLEVHYDIDKHPFSVKKKITSLIRRIAPDGMLTSIGWTANFRTLKHVIVLRTSVHAETEIREVFNEVAHTCKARYPNAFSDLTKNKEGEWNVQT